VEEVESKKAEQMERERHLLASAGGTIASSPLCRGIESS
jgi:hypothetical protein